MDHVKALKALRTLIDAASQQGDADFIYKLLRQMRGIVNDSLPEPYKPRARKKAATRKKKSAQKKTSLRLVKK